jgi:hypothetical protein
MRFLIKENWGTQLTLPLKSSKKVSNRKKNKNVQKIKIQLSKNKTENKSNHHKMEVKKENKSRNNFTIYKAWRLE